MSHLRLISLNYVVVKSYFKIFENSFLKNGLLELLSEALIVSILTHSSNDNNVHNNITIETKIVITNFKTLAFEICQF